MADNTTKPNDQANNDNKTKKEEGSMLTRVSKWLTGKRDDGDEGGATAANASPPQETAASDTAKTAERKAAEETSTGPKKRPRRPPRKRPSRSRSAAGKKPQDKTGKKPAPKKQADKSEKGEQQAQKKPARTRKERPEKTTAASSKSKASYKLLINTDEPEECRIVLLEGGRVESFYVETVSQAQTKGNIYKGRITAVEPNLQAAFVDYGIEKNGFLPFSDIHPEYYTKDVDPNTHWKDLNIQDVIKKGQEVLVEVVKEPTGNKGASLTTYLSLPGRYLVLMPGSDSAGISRKIASESERAKLRKMVDTISIPEGIGYIIRTASKEITKTALSQDVRYLLNLWKEIKKLGQSKKAPSLLHKEQNIISRFLRDHFTSNILEILVDNEDALDQVKSFLDLLPAAQRKKTASKLHQGSQPLFHQFHVEKQIEQVYQPTVTLPSGGSIVINPTEALVAIDVNSGRTAKDKNFEETIFLANMEAAEELARQLRLRDLGGLIVVDFIDMRESKHTREVEKKVRECMKIDKAKVDFTRISKFGLMQISRQKMAAPVQMGSYNVCPHCKGRGMVRSVETQALVHMRHIQTGITRKHVSQVNCKLPMEVARYILNKKRQDLLELEREHGVEVVIEPVPTMSPTDSEIEFVKS